MVDWLAGKRIKGTSSERISGIVPSSSVGGWKEIARTTSTGGLTEISSTWTSGDYKRYYMVLINHRVRSGAATNNRFYIGSGSKATSGYSSAYSQDNGAFTSAFTTDIRTSTTTYDGEFYTVFLSNHNGKSKLFLGEGMNCGTYDTTSYAPGAFTVKAKWTGTGQIDRIYWYGGDTLTDYEIVVLGYDPADNHTTNFWQPLATKELTSAEDITLSFTPKKYLKYALYGIKGSSGSTEAPVFQFNGSTSSYSQNNIINGTSYKYNNLSFTNIGGDGSVSSETFLATGYIYNGGNTSKKIIGNAVYSNTAGTGIGNIVKVYNKWNSNDQISSIKAYTPAGLQAGSILRVWGSD